jgi:hypothetical protein
MNKNEVAGIQVRMISPFEGMKVGRLPDRLFVDKRMILCRGTDARIKKQLEVGASNDEMVQGEN